ncbi:MAG: ribonuclease H-like domain-containing protein [Armatimonadetes bacterium]|nr:ribonuclease H-like domain-containing protein [Armatimonadota bacterium]
MLDDKLGRHLSSLAPPEGEENNFGTNAYLDFPYLHIELPATEFEADSVYIYRRFVSLIGYPGGKAATRLADVRGAKKIHPNEILFLDIETTGLGGCTPLFLIGTMECVEDSFRFIQYFAREYSEERSIIAAVSERLAQTGMLVTFNGKSFDIPFIESRAIVTGVRLQKPKSHLDMLHEARRCYRSDLPNCKFHTLEQMVCGRHRDEDIPSAEIPQAYHEFVRMGDVSKIRLILRHNLYDLLTMADLMYRMWGK